MILDTSVLVALLRGDESVKEKIRECEENREPLRTTTVCAFELYYGAYRSSRARENLKLVEEFLKSLELVNFDEKMARISGAVLAELRREGQMVDIRDLFISAAAIALEDKIVTRNIRRFGRIKNLEVELW